MTRFNLDVRADIADAVNDLARGRGVSRNRILVEALEEYLARRMMTAPVTGPVAPPPHAPTGPARSSKPPWRKGRASVRAQHALRSPEG